MSESKKTINEKELETLRQWEEKRIFEKSVAKPAGADPIGSYSFYDGPPFATGIPHHGHILAGTIKDAIPRYQTMRGKSVRRVWGWDCHGLPIENLIEKELHLNSKKDIEELGIGKFNQAAANSVLRYEAEWKKVVPRLGRWVDMERAYKTMDWTYTETVWWIWKSLFDKGLAYEGHKMMHICPRCETTLAQSEVGMEYHDITDISATVKFELVDEPGTYVLAWTTTPWTLPGNTALAVNENIDYVKATLEEGENKQNNKYIVAKKLAEKVFANKTIVATEDVDIKNYIGKTYTPPFSYYKDVELENKGNIWKIWHADFITDESGTGIAHEAPAFGAEDMELAKANSIPVIKHILMNGAFVDEVSDFAGMVVKKAGDNQSADIEIIKYLAHNGKLFSKEKIQHSYPLCWRCKTPLLNYATSSWFIDVPKIKDKLLSVNKDITWIPDHMRDGRFGKWLEGAREWAVSRSRYWGAPLPVWRSVDGGETRVIGSLAEIARPSNNRYIVVRHGEAQSNVNGVLDTKGNEDNHLTEKGQADAEKLRGTLAGDFDLIVASPFLRAQETATIIANGKEIVTDERLRETDLGVWDSKNTRDFIAWWNEQSGAYMNVRPEGGETHREMTRRVAQVMLDLEEEYSDKTIVIVTHAGPANMLMSWVDRLSDGQIEKNIADEFAFDTSTGYYLNPGDYKKLDWQKISYDENGDINLHRPYIDQITLKDSRGVEMKRIGDVFDCWFESGSMPYGQFHYPFENKETFEQNFPAEFIAEGLDQTRGWFYSLINLGVGLFDMSPYKHVVVNGLVMAEDGNKMSKSQKNYTEPMLLVEKYGADALRFALLSSPLVKAENTPFSDSLVDEVYKKNIVRLENCLEFFKMNADDVDYNFKFSFPDLNVLDQWVWARFEETLKEVTDGYEKYELDKATVPITSLIDDLSTWYVRRSRDRFKDANNDNTRREGLFVFGQLLFEIAKMIAPIMPFLAERIYKELDVPNKKESIHLEAWTSLSEPEFFTNSIRKTILEEMQKVRNIVRDVLMLRQKNNIPVRQPLASVTIRQALSDEHEKILREELNVKAVLTDRAVELPVLDLAITPELKREGEQRELARTIKDKRKELNLHAGDSITLIVPESLLSLVDEVYQKEMKIVSVTAGEEVKVDKV